MIASGWHQEANGRWISDDGWWWNGVSGRPAPVLGPMFSATKGIGWALRFVVAVASIASLVSCASPNPGGGTPSAPTSGSQKSRDLIAFVNDPDSIANNGDEQIELVNSAGQIMQLTHVRSTNVDPAWSPDAKQIVFTSDRDGNAEIYVMNADGGNTRRITDNPAQDDFPTWSPDGKTIAFTSDRGGATSIFLMNADGSNLRRLTAGGVDFHPAWSADSKRIVFTRSTSQDKGELMVINVDTSQVEQITHDGASDTYPDWSQDGKRIVFSSNKSGPYQLYTIKPDGSNETRLAQDSYVDAEPSWSADGLRIAYTSVRNGEAEVWIMNADGSGQIQVVNGGGFNRQPAMSPR